MPRFQRTQNIKKKEERRIGSPPKKKQALKKDKTIILPYSAKNKKTKGTDLYSVLNPETSSLSPSGKSKGARLVSTKKVKNQRKKNKIKNRNTNTEFVFFNLTSL